MPTSCRPARRRMTVRLSALRMSALLPLSLEHAGSLDRVLRPGLRVQTRLGDGLACHLADAVGLVLNAHEVEEEPHRLLEIMAAYSAPAVDKWIGRNET